MAVRGQFRPRAGWCRTQNHLAVLRAADPAGAIERRFAWFDAAPWEAGYLAMGGQIVDATLIAAPRPRLSKYEKATVKADGVPAS
jgi:hypothetical protein